MRHKLNDAEHYEALPIDIVLNKETYPIAFNEKVEELMDNDSTMSREEAEKLVSTMRIQLELYYERGGGLFAVESDAVECGTIFSPYTKDIYTD